MSLETREIKLFWRDIPRDFVGISRKCPKSLREKFVCSIFVPYNRHSKLALNFPKWHLTEGAGDLFSESANLCPLILMGVRGIAIGKSAFLVLPSEPYFSGFSCFSPLEAFLCCFLVGPGALQIFSLWQKPHRSCS